MEPISVCFIGCGAALEFLHKEPILEAARRGWASIVAVADPVERRRELASRWFGGLRTYASSRELFAEERRIDLTVVASPPCAHRADVEAAFAAGSHVLCEKPLAHNVEDAEAMAAAGRRAGRIFAVGMTRRFYPAVEQLRRSIAKLPIDTPIRFVFRQGAVYNWPVASTAPFRRDIGGGGVLLDMGVHLTDILGLIFGWGKAAAAYDDALIGGVEANSLVDLSLERATGRLHLSWDTNLDSALMVTAGDDEYWMPIGQIDVLQHRRSRGKWQPVPVTVSWPVSLEGRNPKLGVPRSHNDCMRFQLISVLRSVIHGEVPMASSEDGVSALRIIYAAYEMAQPLEQPWLGKEEQIRRKRQHWRSAAVPSPSR